MEKSYWNDRLILSRNGMQVFHLVNEDVVSTQDEAKRLLDACNNQDWLNENPEEKLSSLLPVMAVMANTQKKGRGTNGRAWVASKGNLFLTCALPQKIIPMSKITLLPLLVGVIIAEQVATQSKFCRPTVKWPNDVLLNGRKIAGILIENHHVGSEGYWLVGIGVNIEAHPVQLPSEKDDSRSSPRPATSLREIAGPNQEIPTAVDLGLEMTNALKCRVLNLKVTPPSSIIEEWKSWANMGSRYEIRKTGEVVTTVGIELDGRLCVIGEDGTERLLAADYLY